MMRRRDVVAGLAAGVAAGVAGAAFLRPGSLPPGFASRGRGEGAVRQEGPAAAFIVQEVGPQRWGSGARALGVGAVDVRQPPHSHSRSGIR